MRTILISIVAISILAGTTSKTLRASESSADDLWKAAEQGNKEAKEALISMATAGDPDAQNDVGKMFYNGSGVEKDPVEAVKWFREAAEQGFAKGQTNLGLAYANGTGVEKDPVEAVKWFSKAADQDLAIAQLNLGVMFYNGTGVEKDPVEAAKWLRKAAEQGLAQAQSKLGFMYTNGLGVEKDPVEAAKWFSKAAEQGDAIAQANLGVLYLTIDFGRPTAEEGIKYLNSAAKAGDTDAAKFLGLVYAKGIGTQTNLKDASLWFQKAAQKGDGESMYNLFIISCNQPQVVPVADGLNWLSRAADAGIAKASSTLKQLHSDADDTAALQALDEKAARQVLDEEDRQQAETNPFYAVGKRLRDGVATNTLSGRDVAAATLAFGLAILEDRYDKQQEEKRWVPGVEKHFYYDPQSDGLIITNQPVDILPSPYFPSVRPAH